MIIMYCVKTKGLQGLIPYPGGLAGLAAVCVPGDFTEGWVGAVECFPSKVPRMAPMFVGFQWPVFDGFVVVLRIF